MNRLVRELTPLVWHVARGNGLDRHTAEDVVQAVWLALFRSLDRLADPRALAAWLITTARREAQRAAGRKAPPVPLTDEMAEVLPDRGPGPDAEAVRADRDRRLWRAFSRLPQRCQELLRLTVLAGRAEYRLVADALHLPHGSIGPTRGRCLQRMRGLLDAEGGSG
jgi:RNA polymerase sigma factor (sigma-70 family)